MDFAINALHTEEKKRWKRRRSNLFRKLKKAHCFWSYDPSSIKEIDDDTLIEMVLIHLELPEITDLFTLFSSKRIKNVWIEILIIQGERLFPLNCFIACGYFHIKSPGAYVKSMATRQLNKRIKACED